MQEKKIGFSGGGLILSILQRVLEEIKDREIEFSAVFKEVRIDKFLEEEVKGNYLVLYKNPKTGSLMGGFIEHDIDKGLAYISLVDFETGKKYRLINRKLVEVE